MPYKISDRNGTPPRSRPPSAASGSGTGWSGRASGRVRSAPRSAPGILTTIGRHIHEYPPFDVYAKALAELFHRHELTANEWEKTQSRIYPLLDQYQRDGYASLRHTAATGRVPLASGLLNGKYPPGTAFAANDVRSHMGAERLAHDLAEVERLKKTEVPAGIPMANWAMAWCLKDPLVASVIGGCKNPGQVKANAQAAALVAK